MTKIIDKKSVNQRLKRIAWEVFENNSNEKEIFFVGIGERGGELASILASNIQKISNIITRVEEMRMNKKDPYNNNIHNNLSLNTYKDKIVILCDDVLNSGRTLIYATKYFLEIPLNKLSTVVLVDRNHNLYPIKADYVGLSLATTMKEYISVKLKGTDQGVYIS